MNQTQDPHPGHVIGSIAAASGASVLESALGVATLLSGIAGPRAVIQGPSGEKLDPGINLIIAGAHSAPWSRAEQLLVEPINRHQRMLRDLSRSTKSERLDHLQFVNYASDNTNKAVQITKEAEHPEEALHGLSVLSGVGREFAAMRQPTLILRSPDLRAFEAALPEVLDRAPLLYYSSGRLLSELLRKHPDKNWIALGSHVAAALGGQDQAFEKGDERLGPGTMELVKANLMLTCTRADLEAALSSESESLHRILGKSLLVDPSVIKQPRLTATSQTLKYGYQEYNAAVQLALHRRRSGAEIHCKPKDAQLAKLGEFEAETGTWLAALPENLRPFFSDTLTLPYRLLWTFLTVKTFHEQEDWCLPLAIHLTREVLRHQATLIETLTASAEKAAWERARRVMLGKIADRPCLLKELIRRYNIQRREVHEPILKELLSEGLIVSRPDRLLELTPQGRMSLTKVT